MGHVGQADTNVGHAGEHARAKARAEPERVKPRRAPGAARVLAGLDQEARAAQVRKAHGDRGASQAGSASDVTGASDGTAGQPTGDARPGLTAWRRP